ncbi:MAG TPA: hypothetical protein VK146_12475 [Tabrizicola sp.]|nr:hypothetical protein [Tabrizicola sp.]
MAAFSGLLGAGKKRPDDRTGLERKVRPLLCGVREDETMYAFLTRTIIAEEWPVNGAAVAAEAIYLGKRIGHRKDDVLKRIAPGRRFITASQIPGRNIDDFLDEIRGRA